MRLRLLFGLLLLVACGNDTSTPVALPDAGSAPEDAGVQKSALVVATWNLEWFGATDQGPTDEALQQANATKVFKSLDADLYAVEEVVDDQALKKVALSMSGYDALVVNDSRVEGGSAVYQSPSGQKLGVVFRMSRLDLRASRVVLVSAAGDFNGRAPFEVDFVTKPGGTAFTVIVVHLAPGTDEASYNKRKAAAASLKAFLDAKPEGSLVMVAGDFNDGLEKSSYIGSQTPFQIFLDDAKYAFVSKGLKSPRYPRVIDHQLVTDDFFADYVETTAKVVDGDSIVTDFIDTTSDHDPTSARYEIP